MKRRLEWSKESEKREKEGGLDSNGIIVNDNRYLIYLSLWGPFHHPKRTVRSPMAAVQNSTVL